MAGVTQHPTSSWGDPTPRQRLGRYRVLQRVGEGGMGVVHLAVDDDSRAVAMKVLRPHVAADPHARRRLAREVATLQRVRSPWVAEVIDADTEGDQPFLVTRFVPGPSLEERVRESGPLPPERLADLGDGLGEALAAIHAAGVVHRDLKPANVLLLDDVPVVIDFGIAQVADDVRLTSAGLVMGTPGYLSPEVVAGSGVGEPTDWWGWAATVAFAATGRPPFGGGPVEAVLDRVRRGDADLDGVPAALLGAVRRALAVDPADRPPPGVLRAAVAALRAGVREGGAQVTRAVAAGASAAETDATQAVPAGDATQAVPAEPGRRGVPADDATQALSADAVRGSAPAGDATRAVAVEPDRRPAAAEAATQAVPAARADSPRDALATQPVAVAGGATVAHPESPSPAAAQRPAPPREPATAPYAPVGPAQSPPPGPPAGAPRYAPTPAAPPSAAPWQARPEVPAPSWRPARTGTLAVAALTLCLVAAVVPVVAAAVGVAGMVLARTVDRSTVSLLRRRYERGPRRGDRWLAALGSPFHLLAAALVSIPALVLPALVGVSAAFAAGWAVSGGVPVPGDPVPIAVGSAVAVAVAWWGPGGGSVRRGSRTVARAVAPGQRAAQVTVALLVLVAVGAGLVVYGGADPDWWPLPGPPLG